MGGNKHNAPKRSQESVLEFLTKPHSWIFLIIFVTIGVCQSDGITRVVRVLLKWEANGPARNDTSVLPSALADLWTNKSSGSAVILYVAIYSSDIKRSEMSRSKIWMLALTHHPMENNHMSPPETISIWKWNFVERKRQLSSERASNSWLKSVIGLFWRLRESVVQKV